MSQSEEYKKAYAKQYRIDNPEYNKKYYQDHIEYYQNYYDERAEEIKKRQREYIAKKRGQLKPPGERSKKKVKTPKVPKQESLVKSMCQAKTNKIETNLAIMAAKAAAYKSTLYHLS